MARFGMQVLDMGTPLLNMHAPWELASKFDVYETYRAYSAYLCS
jgi:aspartyl aminopeptidase